jgi:hypothetical protein
MLRHLHGGDILWRERGWLLFHDAAMKSVSR